VCRKIAVCPFTQTLHAFTPFSFDSSVRCPTTSHPESSDSEFRSVLTSHISLVVVVALTINNIFIIMNTIIMSNNTQSSPFTLLFFGLFSGDSFPPQRVHWMTLPPLRLGYLTNSKRSSSQAEMSRFAVPRNGARTQPSTSESQTTFVDFPLASSIVQSLPVHTTSITPDDSRLIFTILSGSIRTFLIE
jgi:hypothetical protein